MSNIDWPKIKKEYLTSTISLTELAEKHSVNPSNLRERAARENWVQTKEEVRQEADKKTTEKIVETIADVNLRHINVFKLLQGEALKKIEAARKTNKEIADSTLKDLTLVLKQAVEGERVAVGLPTSVAKNENTNIYKDEYEEKLKGMSEDELHTEIAKVIQRTQEEKPTNVDTRPN